MSSGPLRAGAAGGSGKWGFVFQNPDAQCKMLGAQCTSSALSVQELYPVRAGAVVHRPRCFHEGGGPRISRVKTDTGGNFQETTSPGATVNNGKWEMCFAGTAGICDAELGWSMDLADGIGNGRVRKPRIRVTKTLQNLPQAPRQSSSGEDIGRGKLLRRQCFEYLFHESLHFEWFG